MSDSLEILEFLKKEMMEYLSLGETKYEIEFYNDFSINSRAEIEVILKTLPGTITNNRLIYPVQIIILVPTKNVDDIKKMLTDFTLQENEKIFEIQMENSQKIKQFFTTPTVIESFNEGQDNYYSTITIEASFILFKGAIFSNDCYVKINDRILNGIINITDNCVKTCDASVTANNPKVKNTVNGIQTTLSIDLDFLKGNELHKKLISESQEIITYDVVYSDGYFDHSYKMILVELSKTVSQGNTMQGRLSFLETIEV